jgi:two-component system, NarL family, response regulator LiaR
LPNLKDGRTRVASGVGGRWFCHRVEMLPLVLSGARGRQPAADKRFCGSDIPRVRKTILLYGLLGGVLIAGLKLIEYRFLVVEHSIEIYGGLVALVFAVLGIWLGLKLTKTEERVVVKEVPVEVVINTSAPFVADTASRERLGITPRELEILELIASGLSNREIAEKLYVSENTVKTHSSRLFDKLSAKRRTQAVQIAKDARLIP